MANSPDAAHLLLVGDLHGTLDVATELARASHGELAIRLPSPEAIDELRYRTSGMVMIDVPIDVANVLARLRGEPNAASAAALPIDGLVGRTVAEVERALILRTLTHCRGNRTSASTILGISVRTMRNKLRSFIEDGIAVSPAP